MGAARCWNSPDKKCNLNSPTASQANQTQPDFLRYPPISYTCDKQFWTIDTINKVRVLRHVPDMPGINSCVYYIGACCTTSPFHIGDEVLHQFHTFLAGCSKVWSVLLATNKTRFKHFLASPIFNPNYVKNYEGGIGQILEKKTTMCNPYFLKNMCPTLKIMNIVPRYRHLVILASSAYHGGFNTGYNIAKATNFADLSWCDVGSLFSQDLDSHCPFQKCVLQVEEIVWRETTDLRSFSEKCVSFHDAVYLVHLA